MQTILSIFFSCVSCFLYLYCILLMFGVGGSLLAGYDTSKEKNKKDKCVLRKTGVFLFVLVALIHVMAELFIYNFIALGIIFLILTICYVPIFLFLINKK